MNLLWIWLLLIIVIIFVILVIVQPKFVKDDFDRLSFGMVLLWTFVFTIAALIIVWGFAAVSKCNSCGTYRR